jgi:hypothetical protein
VVHDLGAVKGRCPARAAGTAAVVIMPPGGLPDESRMIDWGEMSERRAFRSRGPQAVLGRDSMAPAAVSASLRMATLSGARLGRVMGSRRGPWRYKE